MKGQRDSYIDVVKGIGIISIVMGHASWIVSVGKLNISIGPFVYLYHLAIFLFCSGFLYKDTDIDFGSYCAKKIKSLYIPFFVYNIIYLILRYLFVYMGIVNGKNLGVGDLIIHFSNILTFNTIGELLGAFWFVPMMFYAVILYAAIQYTFRFIPNKFWREGFKIVCYIIFSIVGLVATDNHLGLLCNLQISYLFVPIIAIGRYFKSLNLKKFVKPVGLIISFVILVYVLHRNIGIIELSQFMIINKILFYPVTFCGIYFCLCLAHCLCKINILERLFSYIGKYTFDIMAMHFLAFKLVDFIICTCTGQKENMGVFPHTFTNIWPIYYVVGISFPIIIKKLFAFLKDKIRSKIGLNEGLELK